jgi:hypothetical protein
METWPNYNEEGKLTGFDVSALRIGLGEIAEVLQHLPGVSKVRRRRPFSAVPDIHVEFEYQQTAYIVWEPWGDNSRYWIGPDENVAEHPDDIAELERVFEGYTPSIAKRFLRGWKWWIRAWGATPAGR